MTEKKPTIVSHPETNAKVETFDPEVYLSQGWEEVGKKSTTSDNA